MIEVDIEVTLIFMLLQRQKLDECQQGGGTARAVIGGSSLSLGASNYINSSHTHTLQ